ncbi:signal peptidase I [Streptomyces sp. NPDC052396]|uniref:signal peptidase I n=1 Tax=Streptomyces sp. NPDC052396 TaxID=3365689 RepID=UPI0037D737C9
MAVGARSGQEEPDKRPRGTEDKPGPAAFHAQADPPDEPGTDGAPPGTGPSGGAGEGPDGKAPRKHRSFWKELPILIGIALILALFIKTFLVQAFSIPSDSMQDTLQRGDRVLVDKLTPWFGSKPERGEVVVFHDPGGWLQENPGENSGALAGGIQKVLSFVGLMPSAEEKDLIKRVIAVGGDTVECKGDSNPVTVNGKALKEPYIFPGNTPCGDRPFGPVKVPRGRIWVMGDHRQNSLDSRYHQGLHDGTVSVDDVVGRAVFVAWPLDRWSVLSVPGTFAQVGPGQAAALAPPAFGLAGATGLVLRRRRKSGQLRG